MYSDLSAFGVSVCLTLFRKNMERESLLVSAVALWLKERFSSKYMPSSLNDCCVGLTWLL